MAAPALDTGFSGRKVNGALSLETIRGTVVAPQFWVYWETNDFEDTGTTILNASAINQLDKYSGAEIVQQWGTGQFAGKITDHTFGLVEYAFFGGYSVATKAGETTVFVHSFTEDQLNACPSLTITRVDPNVVNQYALGMLNSLEVDVKAGDFARHTSQFMSMPSTSATATPTYIKENEFVSRHVTVTFNNGTAIPLNNFKLTMTKDVNNYWIIGQNSPGDIFAQSVEIKGEMELLYTDQTYKTMRFNNTPESVVVTIQNTDVTIGASSHPTITYTMPVCYVNEWKVDQSIDGMVQQTVSFEAVATAANGYAIASALTNTHTTYLPGGIS